MISKNVIKALRQIKTAQYIGTKIKNTEICIANDAINDIYFCHLL